jgi:hypothetical protein
MIAYNNDIKFRTRFLRELQWHRKQDAIVQGAYGELIRGRFRGCAVGCGLHSLDRIDKKRKPADRAYDNHEELSERLGIPLVLIHLQDRVFEGLPRELALDWPVRFASAIKTGADLTLVWPRFARWLLVDPEHGVIRFAETAGVRAAIDRVAELHALALAGNPPSEQDWAAARGAAGAAWAACWAARATRSAAWAAWAAWWAAEEEAAAVRAAEVVARAEAAGAARAAGAATWAAARAARAAHYDLMATKLIQLMEACP